MNRFIAFFLLALLPALSGCLGPSFRYEPSAIAEKRLPIRAVVWLFKDETPDAPASRSASPWDSSPVFQSNLTRGGSLWRPRLTMDFLSSPMGAALEAQLTESAAVVEPSAGSYPIIEEESKGARLFVEGTVQEASWTHSRSNGGSYRLKVALSATLVRTNAPDLQRFWTKTVELEQPHRGRPAQELAAAVRKAFGGAVEELGKALEQEPAAQALAQGLP